MKRFFLIINLLIFISVFSLQNIEAHPVHISVTNVDILPKQHKIIFSVRVFINDFNTIINKKNHTQIDFSKSPLLKDVKLLVSKYIADNLVFYFGEKENKKSPLLLSYKINKDGAVWFYFEIPKTNCNFEKLSIKNTLLTDLYKNQTNLLILSYKDEQQAYRYTKEDVRHLFTIN